ncbi:MAG: GatB/YqeY domain-containing protein [Caldilineaceae bacterium]
METKNNQPITPSIREQMKLDLTRAMKVREMVTVNTLRTVLGAIDNAEAVPVTTPLEYSNGKTNDVPRKQLALSDIEQILRQELDARHAAALKYQDLGKEGEAARLQQEADVIAHYLGKL